VNRRKKREETMRTFSAFCLALALSVWGAGEQAQAAGGTPVVTLQTTLGEIVLELDAEKAPITVENFLQYVRDGHYDGTIFHRVINNFMIQGGGFDPDMKQLPTRAPIQNEADNGLKNDKYTIAMARTPNPHSASSQFFINTKNNDFLNFTASTDRGWGYAVFGKVVGGFEVVDAIAGVETGSAGMHDDVPLQDVIITKAEVTEK
jgi:peptidyl-prolyl cis-trans isomerase B (cyclophilin B)